MTDPQGPKLIIDSDWKAQAQAEKEKLAAQEKAKAEAAKSAPGAGRAPGMPAGAGAMGAEGEFEDGGEPPKPDLVEIVRMLASQTLLYLGAMPDPETGRRMVSLEMGQFYIEMLATLETKTKGNLDENESAFLTRVLYELRMQYVEIAKAVAKAVEQGKITPGAAGGMGLGAGGISTGGVVTPGGAVPPLNIKPK